ncbi:pentatricopeptide repeat-containing protein At2g03380, mitochondrial [Cucurbita moschata]|uniref:Pentatricopeptide repeat-containing protein At2g03380, mitochondrial n=1 Tax=Cucurbita moschata TaxID=3662 RepID=A0A6J1GZK8_CUCMO|nr:pentatricopeptide repeat-containing protein At2g03380, mitochondrial [Cucurbita moschata]XP_022957572.1 pentatricopeptide repeat-containing protein At2g03380, mitochondrial [Cucurbita moschata]XP_022957573.1 pentatricopeptide repeat-containing protein At2g03380, mitochondrial [Cucurbita moschata]XP_022957574.1 pentatricopeptide repeat-containing protein At2g03380, mitochondrial [Cucurbita moschata]XP_022957575.1 pentatricopeptide repeat-containing protein At2g03380, mitochondrial [Cucurbita 
MLQRFFSLPRIFSRLAGPLLEMGHHISYSTYASQPPLSDLDQTMASVQFISLHSCFYFMGLCRNIDTLIKFHGLLIVHGLVGNLLCDTKLVGVYGALGDVGSARMVFDQMRDPDFYAWKVMIRWYFLNDMFANIIPFYNRMRMSFKECDNIIFSIILKACSELREIDEGRKVHCQIVKVGGPDSFVLTGLIDMYGKCGQIECSSAVFEGIIDKNVVSWTTMIAGYVQNDCAEEGLVLFNRMRESLVESNQFTLGSIITACTRLRALHQGKWVHGYAIKNVIFELNSFLATAFLDMYVKCGQTRDARMIFDELPSIDLVSWTAMIVGYSQAGQPNEALRLFTDKIRSGLLPNSVTAASILSACSVSGNLSIGMLVHGLGIKLGLEECAVKNALIDMYAKCHMIDDAYVVFLGVLEKDVITWNSMISGYAQSGSAYDALRLFNQMRSDSLAPDAITLVSALSASAILGAVQVGSSLHVYSIKEGLFSSNLYIGTALLNLYAKCGDAKSARMVFDSMGDKNIITWSAMIGGYGVQGDGSGSLAIFSDMLKEDLKPNDVIFTTVLSACSYSGMVEEGWRYFKSMSQDYNYAPSMKHYACMVDLLSRSGRLEEALDFIKKMPVQPDISLYGAFLHGCGLYSRFDLGEVIVREMLELHPNEASLYVLLSNLYASDGRWGQVNEVRDLMLRRGLKKVPGYSLVETNAGVPFH